MAVRSRAVYRVAGSQSEIRLDSYVAVVSQVVDSGALAGAVGRVG